MTVRARCGLTAVLLLGARGALHSQTTDTRADSMLRDGAIGRAESLYYAAARVRPRDPEARWQLGRYLISRGALRVGATLVEEAVRFGLDPRVGAATLAPVYLQVGEYHQLATLPGSSLTPAELARARWLVEHPPRVVAPDSLIAVAYRPAAAPGAIGTVTVRVNGRSVDAVISPRVHGLVVSDTNALATQLRRFSPGVFSTPRGVPAVADSITIGRLALANVPVTVASGIGAPALLGFDVFYSYAPTFDVRSRRVLLHPTGISSVLPSSATVLQTLAVENDLLVARGSGWASVTSTLLAPTFREHRWTVDFKRGRIIVEP
jgi:hypothetical protein